MITDYVGSGMVDSLRGGWRAENYYVDGSQIIYGGILKSGTALVSSRVDERDIQISHRHLRRHRRP